MANSEKKEARQAEMARRRAAFDLKNRRDDFEIHGYRANHGSGYGVHNQTDGSIVIGDPLFGPAVPMPFPGARAELENAGTTGGNQTANTLVFGVVGYALSKKAKNLLFLKVTNGGIEAAIPVDGSNPPHLRAFIAAFNTAAAAAATRTTPQPVPIPVQPQDAAPTQW